MPPDKALSPQQVADLTAWVNVGRRLARSRLLESAPRRTGRSRPIRDVVPPAVKDDALGADEHRPLHSCAAGSDRAEAGQPR